MPTYPLFMASEILDMAIQIERQGLEFYRICAQSAVSSEVVGIFEYMIGQEERHLEVFSRMRAEMEDYPIPEAYPNEMRDYVDDFVRDQVFEDNATAHHLASNMKEPLKAIELAMLFEEHSVLFYSAMKQVVRPSEHDSMERIITEEHRHIRRLARLHRKMSFPSKNDDDPSQSKDK